MDAEHLKYAHKKSLEAGTSRQISLSQANKELKIDGTKVTHFPMLLQYSFQKDHSNITSQYRKRFISCCFSTLYPPLLKFYNNGSTITTTN